MRPTSCFSPRMSRHSLFFCLLVDMTFLLTACSIAGSKKNHPTSENGKLALLTSGRPAFQQHVKRAEGSDTTPRLAHAENHERRMYKSRFRQKQKRSRSPAGPRRLGTATRISASLSRRLFAFFGSTLDRDPKGAKYAVLTPGPGMFVNVRNAPRVMIPPSPKTPRVSPCEPLCAIL